MSKIHKGSHKRIIRLHGEGFAVLELSMMYRSSQGSIERILENQ